MHIGRYADICINGCDDICIGGCVTNADMLMNM